MEIKRSDNSSVGDIQDDRGKKCDSEAIQSLPMFIESSVSTVSTVSIVSIVCTMCTVSTRFFALAL